VAGRASDLVITRRLVGFLAASALVLTMIGVASNAEDIEFTSGESDSTSVGVRTGGADARDEVPIEVDEEPELRVRRAELPSWFLWAVGVIAALGALWFLSRQRINVLLGRRRLPKAETTSTLTEAEQADAIAEFADDLIDELQLGGEPRLAIQRAYAAVETGFGSREMRRRPAETPLKYLDRVFGRRRQAAPALGRLTDLFQIARFSTEPVDESMREAAIDALREIRDQYRAIGRVRVRR